VTCVQAESQTGGDAESGDVKSYKSLARIVAEHKDIMKLSHQLSSVIASLRSEVNDVISGFSNKYDELWKSVSTTLSISDLIDLVEITMVARTCWRCQHCQSINQFIRQ